MNNKILKSLLLTGGLSATALIAPAQTLKIQAGASMSKLDLNTNITRLLGDPLYSPYFGIGLDFFEHKHFNLSAGIGYLQKGGSDQLITTSITNPEGTRYIAQGKADYLTAQASFNWKILPGRKLYPYLSAGPRLDVLIATSENLDALSGKDGLKSINLGMNAGAGLNYIRGKYLFGAKVEYLANFTSMGSYDATLPDRVVHNQIKDQTFACSILFGMRLR